MNSGDLSDGTKLGLVTLCVVSLFIIVFNIYTMVSSTFTYLFDRSERVMTTADTQTVIGLTEVDKDAPISGATLYAVLSQYGSSVSGIVVDSASGLGISSETVYKSANAGSDKSIEALMSLVEKAGFDKNYYIFRNEPPTGESQILENTWFKIVASGVDTLHES